MRSFFIYSTVLGSLVLGYFIGFGDFWSLPSRAPQSLKKNVVYVGGRGVEPLPLLYKNEDRIVLEKFVQDEIKKQEIWENSPQDANVVCEDCFVREDI